MSVSSSSLKSAIPKIVLGTMEFGRRATEAEALAQIQLFVANGHAELDTARMYCHGETENILGRILSSHEKLRSSTAIASKAYPFSENDNEYKVSGFKGLTAHSVTAQNAATLQALQSEKLSRPLDIYYLHAPDKKTPILETLRAYDVLYRKEKFHRLGLSNYSAWEVAEIFHLCEREGLVRPTVYQGMYNSITRAVEPELLPCLQHYGIAFYAYNPLAGGLLTGRYKFSDIAAAPAGRFFSNEWSARYRERYWKQENFDVIEAIASVLKSTYGDGEAKVTVARAAIRWMLHHSKLSAANGDAVILGASTQPQLEENLKACAEGKLDERVVKAFDDAWNGVKAFVPTYFR